MSHNSLEGNLMTTSTPYRDWLLSRGHQNTLLSYLVKCHGRFVRSFKFTYPWIFDTANLPRETSVTLLNTVSPGKRAIYHGESVPCNLNFCNKLHFPVALSQNVL